MINIKTESHRAASHTIKLALGYALFAQVILHGLLLLLFRSHPILASRLSTSAAPLLAAFCGLWRAQHLPPRERLPWRLLSASMALWAVGQAVEAIIGRSSSASTSRPMPPISSTSSLPFPCCSRCPTLEERIRAQCFLSRQRPGRAGCGTHLCSAQSNVFDPTRAATAMANIYIASAPCLPLPPFSG